MDKETLAGLNRFLGNADERELNYTGHGKLVVRSAGDGTTCVTVDLSPLVGSADHPRMGPFYSANALYEGIKAGLEELCEHEDVADTLEAFVEMICHNQQTD